MNKSIYENAIGLLLKIQGRLSTDYDKFLEVKQALEHAKKQEKLLNKIKGILDRPNNSINDIHVDKFNRYYEIEILVRELENDK